MSDDTRLKLLNAALAFLAAPTPPAISTRALADRAEVNLSLISYHFGGRDLLLRSAQTYAALQLADAIRRENPLNQTIDQNAALRDLLHQRLPLIRAALAAGGPQANAPSRDTILAALANALSGAPPETRDRAARALLAEAVFAAFVDDGAPVALDGSATPSPDVSADEPGTAEPEPEPSDAHESPAPPAKRPRQPAYRPRRRNDDFID